LKRWDETDGPAFVLAGGMQQKEADFMLESQNDELDELKKMYKSEDLTNETADIVMKRAVRTVELYKIITKIAHAVSDRMVSFESMVQRRHLTSGAEHQVQTVAQLEAAQAQQRIVRETTLVSAKAARDEAQSKLAELKRDRESFTIKSDIDGVVVYGAFAKKAWQEMEAKKLAADEKVTPDQVLMTVYAPKRLRLRADWPEGQMGLLSKDAKVKVTPVALPDVTYDGTCETPSIFGAAKGEAQAFDVIIDLPGVDERLAPGFKANVNFDGGKIDDALLVPATAVWRGKVWVRKAGDEAKAKDQQQPIEDEVRSVVVGRSDGRLVQIKSGLSEGELVLTQAKRPGAGQ
jgi:multidrug efflux pump subunit AcrA (membrane-fusion protein)